MHRSLAYLLFASQLLGQAFRTAPQQAPIDALIQSYQSALNSGKFDEAVASREQARALLGQIPVDDPQFLNWAQRISGIYENCGFGTQARDVLEQSLARAGGLSESSPARIGLLDALARSWEQDRNLLKAVNYLEQALTAAEAQPAHAPAPSASPRIGVAAGISASRPVFARVSAFYRGYSGINNEDLYRRLFSLYRQLGRPQDAAGLLTRVAAHVKDNDGLLASLYREQGQIDQAAAIYKRQAAQAADPQSAAQSLQSLASLYQSGQNYAEAAAAMQQAIGKMEASGPDAAANSIGMRQQLANLLHQAGQLDAADQVYRQLMSQPGTDQANQQFGVVTGYAGYLAQTNRASQAETLLQEFEAGHSSAEPWQQQNLMMAFANVERSAGKPQLADEYQRRASASMPQPAVPDGESRIASALQRANQAANAGKLDEAFNLTVQALSSAPGAPDPEVAPIMAVQVAGILARKAPAQADEIYRRSLGLAESWSAANVSPLTYVQENYARALQSQQRWSEFEQMVERFRGALTAAHGAGTGWEADALRLRTEVLYRPERKADALLASQELLKLEESLAGATSEPYLQAIETLTNAMEVNDDRAGALPLRRKAVAIVDLASAANDWRRATLRINAAMAFAHEGQFDEAEALASEAVAIGEHTQPRQAGFTSQLQQILQMKLAAQTPPAPKQ